MRGWTYPERSRAAAMVDRGLSNAEIALALGRTVAAIVAQLKVIGKRRLAPWTGEADRELLELRERGWLVVDVAERIGRSPLAVHARLNRLGATRLRAQRRVSP